MSGDQFARRVVKNFILFGDASAGWAYAAALALIGIPVFLFESLLWSLVIYWGVGFEHTAGRCGFRAACVCCSLRQQPPSRRPLMGLLPCIELSCRPDITTTASCAGSSRSGRS